MYVPTCAAIGQNIEGRHTKTSFLHPARPQRIKAPPPPPAWFEVSSCGDAPGHVIVSQWGRGWGLRWVEASQAILFPPYSGRQKAAPTSARPNPPNWTCPTLWVVDSCSGWGWNHYPSRNLKKKTQNFTPPVTSHRSRLKAPIFTTGYDIQELPASHPCTLTRTWRRGWNSPCLPPAGFYPGLREA
ncbi:hypothetical protein SKAU_G00090460 [Synaphobranchus kaupii]|uniref:Uncharacterized protein n=1 Tax=Synaphobranchus kaupii TaxID=118154 RepID=A0A9Q1J6F4_SYNKA|nr:hypothetical protein SKAU_G00090460 [Synaphobranchus kaupii]